MNVIKNAYDGQQWRIQRLEKALRIAQAILHFNDQQIEFMVRALNDDHGNMQVFWKYPPTERQKQAFRTAWDLCNGKSRAVLPYIEAQPAQDRQVMEDWIKSSLQALATNDGGLI